MTKRRFAHIYPDYNANIFGDGYSDMTEEEIELSLELYDAIISSLLPEWLSWSGEEFFADWDCEKRDWSDDVDTDFDINNILADACQILWGDELDVLAAKYLPDRENLTRKKYFVRVSVGKWIEDSGWEYSDETISDFVTDDADYIKRMIDDNLTASEWEDIVRTDDMDNDTLESYTDDSCGDIRYKLTVFDYDRDFDSSDYDDADSIGETKEWLSEIARRILDLYV